MNRLDGFQADMQGAIHRGAGGGQNPHHGKGLVVMVYKTDLAASMGHNNLVTQLIIQLARHLRPQHHVIKLRKHPALLQAQAVSTAITQMLKIGVAGPQHPIATVGVPQ